MEKIFTLMCYALLAVGLLQACDDVTEQIGTDVMPSYDNVSTSQSIFSVSSRSVAVDSVYANTSSCYLGRVIDPETRSLTTADFLAQFHVLENYAFPSKTTIVTDTNGEPICDSCEIRVYFSDYYGDSLSTMKLQVIELDTNRVMEENVNYYTNLDPQQYVSTNPAVNKTLTYSVRDLSDGTTAQVSSGYRNIRIKLPTAYGQMIMNKYYENPNFFANSYQFIHHVCPGFYFKILDGVGSMINAKVSSLNVYFRYHETTVAGNDTIVDGLERMGATEEVIQNTRADNVIPTSMLSEDSAYTYLKSPAGIFTEITLPIDSIIAGEHYTDTINNVSLSLRRYNSVSVSDYNLSPPTNVLMVRKGNLKLFFENKQLPDSKNSYLSTYSNNAYTFSNISRLVTNIKNERDAGAGVTTTDTEDSRKAKYAIWDAANPDWDKVMLVPVTCDYSTSSSSTTTTKTLLRVRHNLSLSSVKLEGGKDSSLSITVLYSRFAN